jgi:hypothetical protein
VDTITIKVTVTPQGVVSLSITPKASVELVLAALEEVRKQILHIQIGTDE